MTHLLAIWAACSTVLAVVLQRHLRMLDRRRRVSAGDFTIDRFDGLGPIRVDVYAKHGHTCPECFRPCRHVVQLENGVVTTRWYFCGHCAPPMMQPKPIGEGR